MQSFFNTVCEFQRFFHFFSLKKRHFQQKQQKLKTLKKKLKKKFNSSKNAAPLVASAHSPS